jgi:hypothetical protein
MSHTALPPPWSRENVLRCILIRRVSLLKDGSSSNFSAEPQPLGRLPHARSNHRINVL